MTSRFLITFLLCVGPFSAEAQLRVVTTLPDLAEIVREVGGHKVQVRPLLRGTEDPHHLDASPDFIRHVNKADVVCRMGLELEAAWLDRVVAKTGRPQLQQGGKGHCDASRYVQVREIPHSKVDRSMGDVHAHGNPHYNLSPLTLKQAAAAIADSLIAVDPTNQDHYNQGRKQFEKKMDQLQQAIQKKLGPLHGQKFIEYHREFSYFFAAYGLESIGSLEEKPGVPPSLPQIVKIANAAKQENVLGLLAGANAPPQYLRRFSELSSRAYKVVPTMVQKEQHPKTIAELQNDIASALLQMVSGKTAP